MKRIAMRTPREAETGAAFARSPCGRGGGSCHHGVGHRGRHHRFEFWRLCGGERFAHSATSAEPSRSRLPADGAVRTTATAGKGRTGEHCASNGCALTYDIVACKDGWCGIAVNADKTCGRIGVRLAADAKSEGGIEFNGKLELAKGSAPYTVKAWYRSKTAAPVCTFSATPAPSFF